MQPDESAAYWKVRAESYRDTLDTSYHRSRLEMIDQLVQLSDLTGRTVDFGCGDGVFARHVLASGGEVVGIDIDPSMVEAADAALAQYGQRWRGVIGGVEALAELPEGGSDALFAFNVLAYLDQAQADEFYALAYRVLRPGGVLITTHSNELFDLFTLNRYTVHFFETHFSDHADVSGVRTLLTNPDLPNRTMFASRENPLAYPSKLRRFGFQEERQEFSILHDRPPLLDAAFDPDALRERQVRSVRAVAPEEKWKLMFMCSIYGSRAVRMG